MDLIGQRLELVSVTKGQDLIALGKAASHVHYPVGALISMVSDAADGYSFEMGVMGNADMVGMCALQRPSFYRARVRQSGLAYRLQAQYLVQVLPHCPTHAAQLRECEHSMLSQLSAALACSKSHSIEQQLARWLLSTCNQTGSRVIDMTQQELADLLGFRREAICLSLNRMAKAEFICMRRHTITVIEPQKLRMLSCDCGQ